MVQTKQFYVTQKALILNTIWSPKLHITALEIFTLNSKLRNIISSTFFSHLEIVKDVTNEIITLKFNSNAA